MNISDCQIVDKLYEGNKSNVYRAVYRDSTSVILKQLRNDHLNSSELARFRKEYELTNRLKSEGIIEVYGFEHYKDRPVILMEDFEGESCRNFVRQWDLKTFLANAVQATEALEKIHSQNVIHKDVTSSNILWNPTTGQLKFIDFGLSTELSSENPVIQAPNTLEGTLAYMSPEQTGRMNRSTDHRSDLYSLGVVFYELLSGQLPFSSDDPMELVHSHIAIKPTPLHEICRTTGLPEIPKTISRIVQKLLEKTAEDRYQSAYGVKMDLEKCLEQLEYQKEIELFDPGQNDFTDKFQIPQKLYGRGEDVQTLLSSFARVATGNKELILVAGYSGIGKSSLVREIHKPIIKGQGYFISGKFDQLKRDIPYFPIIQALQELIHQILTESDEQIVTWKEKLRRALGNNGQVIVEVIPDLELIIGEQPAIPELPASESQNRFNFTFQNFIHAFTARDHPLVLFLDDLQWADLPSLNLIELIMSDEEIGHILLIGAYRDNEVDASHPLMLMLEELNEISAAIHKIILTPLKLPDVNDIVSDTLKTEPEATKLLADLCFKKTRGNPFFLNQFLHTLHQEELIHFDREEAKWCWEMESIKQVGFTDNVIDLMVNNLLKLPQRTQQVLQFAACIGNRFDSKTLAKVSEQTVQQTNYDLWEALKEGFILSTDELYQLVGYESQESEDHKQGKEAPAVNPVYQFLHDRVQQAAYSLIPEEQKPQIHLKAGYAFLHDLHEAEKENQLFTIVNQVNAGKSLIDAPEEKRELAELNLKAGKKAKDANAYEAALRYISSGVEYLGSDPWKTSYALSFELYLEKAECEYLNGHYKKAENCFAEVYHRAGSKESMMRIHFKKAKLYAGMSDHKQSVKEALRNLKIANVAIPKRYTKFFLLIELVKIRWRLTRKSILKLSELPAMEDLDKKIQMDALMSLSEPAYFVSQNLFILAVLKMVNLSLKHGNAKTSPFAYSVYALVLSGVLGDYQSGYRFGQLAMQLDDQSDSSVNTHQVYGHFGAFVNHWKQPYRSSLPLLKKSFQHLQEVGDLSYGAYNSAWILWNLWVQGEALDSYREQCKKFHGFLRKIKSLSLVNTQIALGMIACLKGESQDLLLDNEDFTEKQFLEKSDNQTILYWYAIQKLELLFRFGQYKEAAKAQELCRKNLSGPLSLVILPDFYFYSALLLTVDFLSASAKEQRLQWNQLVSYRKKLKKWADQCEENAQHKYLLVAAEMAHLKGEIQSALNLYDQAIKSAQEHGMVQIAALANELAMKFWLEQDREAFARNYYSAARLAYLEWGATAKAEDLESNYPQFALAANRSFSVDKTTSVTDSATSLSQSEALDLSTVMKASQTLSSEIVLGRLLKKFMRIIFENAGAQKGILILKNELGEFTIEAKGTVEGDDLQVLQSLSIKDAKDLSAGIVKYILRTQNPVVLNDATNEGSFTEDPYVQAFHPKSLLCLPILHQSKLLGLLYLENNLTTGAFTADRLEMLRLLITQAAISIENATLYNHLEEKVEERTHQLHEALEETQQKEQEITHVNQVTRIINSTLDFERIMESITETLLEIFNFDQLIIGLVDEETKELVFHSANGVGITPEIRAHMKKLRISLEMKGSFFVKTILKNEHFYISPITEELLKFFDPTDLRIHEIDPAKSVLFYPLEVQNQVIGLIFFGHSTEPFFLEEQEIHKIQRYVIQVASAIHNARLYEDLKNTKVQLAETEKIAAMTQTFQKFVPKQFLTRIANEGLEKIELGKAESDNITILFSDIRSFTNISETMSPQQLLNLLNAYLRRMNEPIHANRGFVDKFIGDAIMALFDLPEVTDAEEAKCALKAAIGMQKALKKYNRHRSNSGYVPINTGIGIHSGPVIIGTVGSEDRMDSTVLGDAVNLASRLEGLTKHYNTRIIISSDTYQLVRDDHSFMCREIDFVSVKGKKEPVNVFELFNSDPEEIREKKQLLLPSYNEALTAFYERKWGESQKLFQACLKIYPEDMISQLYFKRCEEYKDTDPGSEWQGIKRQLR